MKLNLSLFLLLIAPLSFVTAQELRVTGTVRTADSGMPLPGASVFVKGTSVGTSTDFDGNYAIEGVASDATLVYSFVGFRETEVSVNGREEIDVALKTDAAALDEVVITGYSKERKVDVTGAITVVEMAPIEGQSRSSGNVMQALQGQVPGLFIEKSGDPTGASSRILIRGITTLGNNDPLYVIDGVPTQRQEVFSSINPDAIESIQVLKDASASSLYGARAGNGVIVVTTKNKIGIEEKVSVSINSNISVQSEKNQRYEMLNALQRGEVLWRASVNDRADPSSGYGQIYDFDWNMDFDNPILNSISVQPFVGGDENVPAGDTDWQDAMYETGYVFNNELTVSANSEKSSFLVNMGHLKNTGILKYTNYERYTAKINANTKLFNDKVRFGINTQFSTSDETLASRDVGSALTPSLAVTLPPTIPVYDANGNFAGPLGAGYSDRNNPLLMQYLNRWDNAEKNNFFGNIYGEVDLLKNLVFRTSLGLDFSDFKKKDIERRVSNGFITRSNNSLTFDTNKFTSVVFTNTLSYELELERHNFGLLLGLESVKNDFDSVLARGEDFAVEQESYFVLDAATGARTSNGRSSGSRLLSQFGKMNYSFDDRYLASVTVRRDGSSRFGRNNRYGIFPAVTAGWRIINEEFLKDNEFITNLKLRAGYGEVGNQAIGDLARFGLYEARYGSTLSQYQGGFFERYYNVGTAYDINGNDTGSLPSGFVSVQAENPDLKWETTKEWNYGIDFAFFQNKLSGSFDYFSRKTVDILTTPPIPSVMGEGQQRVLNGASTETKGWEFSLGYSNTLENGMSFSVFTNLSAFQDEITFLPEDVRSAFPGTAENSILGHSQFSIFGYKSDGLFQSEEDIANSPEQVGARPGGLKFKDLNGDGVINTDDRDFIGTTLPDLEYGIRLNAEYKNWDFSVFGSGVAGRIGLDPYIFWNNYAEGRSNSGLGVLEAWTPQNPNSDIPSLSLAFNDHRTSDYLFRNNSYFKLRNLQLGYTLSDKLINQLGPLQYFRIYLQGENLLWFTPNDYIGSDPERTDVSRIPVPTVVSLGLNINL